MTFQLWQLRKGDVFFMDGVRYTVKAQADAMTELFGNGRYWAWPCCVNVEQ